MQGTDNFGFKEQTLGLDDGLVIATKQWGRQDAATKILATHGWLDSANTFDNLAPLLVSSPRQSICFVAMDFSGHGKSSHKSRDAGYSMAERVLEVVDVADKLGWDKFILMGHSMGGAVAVMVAGVIPERIQKLVVFDTVGPWPYDPEEATTAAEALRMAVLQRRKMLKRRRRIYDSVDTAVERYMRNNPYMHEKSVRILLQRCGEEVEEDSTTASPQQGGAPDVVGSESNSSGAKQASTNFCFRHDVRLQGAGLYRYDEKSVQSFVERIESPVLIFLATNPLRRSGKTRWIHLAPVFQQRIALMKDATVEVVEGSHHLHLDKAEDIYKTVLDFLEDPSLLPRRGLLPPPDLLQNAPVLTSKL